MPSKDEIVLITGTSRGIGQYLVEHFLQKGSRVVGCSRSGVELDESKYHHHIVDVGDETQVKALLSEIGKRYGRLDVLINNAGIASMNHVLLTPVETVDRIFATNFRGTFLLCREAVKLMRRHKYGRIVNFSSVAVPLALEGEAIYAASKSAVVTFSRILAREVSVYGITCNVLAPTPIDTDLIRGVPEEKIQNILEQLVVKEMGKPEEVAHAVDFLVNPKSGFLTGQVICMGGL